MKETKLVTLCGEWDITTDPENNGWERGWQSVIPDTEVRRINVYDHMPNSYWTMELSYSNVFPQYHGYVWYYKTIPTVPTLAEGERMLLEFERAGYVCEAFVNGVRVGEHRDHEKKFAFDVTDAIRTEDENFLAVRCFEPRATGRDIDGIRLREIPNACFANIDAHMLGSDEGFCLECIGGIMGAVHLRAVPSVRIEELYIRPHYETGEVDVTVFVKNTSDAPAKKTFDVVVNDKKAGTAVLRTKVTLDVPVGDSEFTAHVKIENHRLWDLEKPFLYLASVSVEGEDLHTASFGFKDFRVKNGFFFLNGKRIFLKGAHCGIVPAYAISIKALGFNIIRTISRVFTEELLDICDEIGLLVLDAAGTAWGMTEHPGMPEQMKSYNVNMIRRHRNHPSVAAYCLFNEEERKDLLIDSGVKLLPLLRSLAPDTLFLLHSGRWDKKNMLGSASNPGSEKWDTYFGKEGRADVTERVPTVQVDGYNDLAMGDIHVYPPVPMPMEQVRYFREIGNDCNPIFISECGIGSQSDPMSRYLESTGEYLSGAIVREEVKRLWDEAEEFLDFYDMRDVYPLSCDLARETERLNGAQRTLLYNIFRSNPMINGFSFTSFSVSNEGVLQGKLVIKDSLARAIQQGHEPLRFALFTEERTVYANRPFEIEAVLCNEDVLAPGSYAAVGYIRNKNGCVWKKQFTAECPESGFGGMPPLAVSVLREKISLPAGEYVFSVRLCEGGVAYDGDLKFTVAEATDVLCKEIAVLGVSDKVLSFLSAHGVHACSVEDFGEDLPAMLLVGNPEGADAMETAKKMAERGASVVFADIGFFMNNPAHLSEVAGADAIVKKAGGTIYHQDHVCVRHPIFEGIAGAGVLEFDRFNPVYPAQLFASVLKPSRTVCAAIRVDGSFTVPGLAIGEYAAGEGRFVLNSFRISENIGAHPFADMLLLNFVKNYA
ncbi:MAG: hypothetical protein J6J66_07425 [Clostridia bacterium]|nr:hypothetical protein [Clostridia bacterium]